ncbi:MAG: hypothetical protein ACTSWY_08645 [Promethearchaeota archaeon]
MKKKGSLIDLMFLYQKQLFLTENRKKVHEINTEGKSPQKVLELINRLTGYSFKKFIHVKNNYDIQRHIK